MEDVDASATACAVPDERSDAARLKASANLSALFSKDKEKNNQGNESLKYDPSAAPRPKPAMEAEPLGPPSAYLAPGLAVNAAETASSVVGITTRSGPSFSDWKGERPAGAKGLDEIDDDDDVDVEMTVIYGVPLRQLYRIERGGGALAAMGPAGLGIIAVSGCRAVQRQLLIYDAAKKPIVRVPIHASFKLYAQPDNYATFYASDGRGWSVLMRSAGDWLALARQVLIARHSAAVYHAHRPSSCVDGGRLGVTTLDLTPPPTPDGEAPLRVAENDTAQVTYAVYASVSTAEQCSRRWGAVQEFPFHGEDTARMAVEYDAAARGLAEGLRGVAKGGRRLILVPNTAQVGGFTPPGAPPPYEDPTGDGFLMYDATVMRVKKGRRPSKASSSGEQMEAYRGAASGAVATGRRVSEGRVAPTSDDSGAPAMKAHASWVAASSGGTTPPLAPRQSQRGSVGAEADALRRTMVEVQRQMESLSKSVGSVAIMMRGGGTWTPAELDEETQQALEAVREIRIELSLPDMSLELLSLTDLRQLAAELQQLRTAQADAQSRLDALEELREELRLERAMREGRDEEKLSAPSPPPASTSSRQTDASDALEELTMELSRARFEAVVVRAELAREKEESARAVDQTRLEAANYVEELELRIAAAEDRAHDADRSSAASGDTMREGGERASAADHETAAQLRELVLRLAEAEERAARAVERANAAEQRAAAISPTIPELMRDADAKWRDENDAITVGGLKAAVADVFASLSRAIGPDETYVGLDVIAALKRALDEVACVAQEGLDGDDANVDV